MRKKTSRDGNKNKESKIVWKHIHFHAYIKYRVASTSNNAEQAK